MCTIKLLLPKVGSTASRVLSCNDVFEQVIGGAFSQDTTDKLANDNVTTKASKQIITWKKMMTSQSM